MQQQRCEAAELSGGKVGSGWCGTRSRKVIRRFRIRPCRYEGSRQHKNNTLLEIRLGFGGGGGVIFLAKHVAARKTQFTYVVNFANGLLKVFRPAESAVRKTYSRPAHRNVSWKQNSKEILLRRPVSENDRRDTSTLSLENKVHPAGARARRDNITQNRLPFCREAPQKQTYRDDEGQIDADRQVRNRQHVPGHLLNELHGLDKPQRIRLRPAHENHVRKHHLCELVEQTAAVQEGRGGKRGGEDGIRNLRGRRGGGGMDVTTLPTVLEVLCGGYRCFRSESDARANG